MTAALARSHAQPQGTPGDRRQLREATARGLASKTQNFSRLTRFTGLTARLTTLTDARLVRRLKNLALDA